MVRAFCTNKRCRTVRDLTMCSAIGKADRRRPWKRSAPARIRPRACSRLRRAAWCSLRLPVKRRGGAVPGPGDRRPSPEDRILRRTWSGGSRRGRSAATSRPSQSTGGSSTATTQIECVEALSAEILVGYRKLLVEMATHGQDANSGEGSTASATTFSAAPTRTRRGNAHRYARRALTPLDKWGHMTIF